MGTRLNGLAQAMALLKSLEPKKRHKVLTELRAKSPHIALLYDQCEFLYQDLIHFDDPSLQKLLTTIKDEDWLIAFKLTSEPLRQLILSNMSQDRSSRFKEAYLKQPKMHRSRVVRIQSRIAKIALDGIKKGELRKRHSTG